jgi:hypothetical protein
MMSNDLMKKVDKIATDYVSEAILNEDLAGTHNKDLSDDAKAEVMNFIKPILYWFYGLVALTSTIIVYFSFSYLFGFESILISCILVIISGSVALFLRNTIVGAHIVIGSVMAPIIFSVIFRYIFFGDYVKSIYFILFIAVIYIACNLLITIKFNKYSALLNPTSFAIMLLILIKYFRNGITEFALYSVMSATAVITLLLFFNLKIRKDKFIKAYSEIREQDD